MKIVFADVGYVNPSKRGLKFQFLPSAGYQPAYFLVFASWKLDIYKYIFESIHVP